MANLSELTGTWNLDPAHTELGFIARHAMVTKVRGKINDFTATAQVDGENLANSTVKVEMQADSISTNNAQRDGHLRSSDFFETDKYPTWTLTSTKVEKTGDDTFEITGDLTIKGVTKSVTVPFEFAGIAKDPYGNDRAGFEGGTKIKRSDFGLNFNAALETGGVLISDDIRLEFEISAIRA